MGRHPGLALRHLTVMQQEESKESSSARGGCDPRPPRARAARAGSGCEWRERQPIAGGGGGAAGRRTQVAAGCEGSAPAEGLLLKGPRREGDKRWGLER